MLSPFTCSPVSGSAYEEDRLFTQKNQDGVQEILYFDNDSNFVLDGFDSLTGTYIYSNINDFKIEATLKSENGLVKTASVLYDDEIINFECEGQQAPTPVSNKFSANFNAQIDKIRGSNGLISLSYSTQFDFLEQLQEIADRRWGDERFLPNKSFCAGLANLDQSIVANLPEGIELVDVQYTAQEVIDTETPRLKRDLEAAGVNNVANLLVEFANVIGSQSSYTGCELVFEGSFGGGSARIYQSESDLLEDEIVQFSWVYGWSE